MMVALSTIEDASISYKNVEYDFLMLEFVSDDKEENTTSRCPTMSLPFREKWLPRFNNPNYELVHELLWLTKY